MKRPDVSALLANARAKAGLPPVVTPPAPPAPPFEPEPKARVKTIYAGWRPLRGERGTVVETVAELHEGVRWIFWLADDGARRLSHPSFLLPESK